jgi:hypothetical protein
LAAVLSQEAVAVPASLALSTIRAGGLALASGVVSAKVATLTEGVLNAMWVTKLKVPVIMLTVCALSLGGTGLAYRMGAAQATGKITSAALVSDPAPSQPKPPTDKERLEKLLKQLDEQIRKLEAESQPVEQERLREILKQIQEEFRNGRAVEDLTSEVRLLHSMVLRREARVAEAKRREIARALSATAQKEIEKVLELVRNANDKKSEVEILEEIEKAVKEMKRKAQERDEGVLAPANSRE